MARHSSLKLKNIQRVDGTIYAIGQRIIGGKWIVVAPSMPTPEAEADWAKITGFGDWAPVSGAHIHYPTKAAATMGAAMLQECHASSLMAAQSGGYLQAWINTTGKLIEAAKLRGIG